MDILLIDNNDSFTFNLAQQIAGLGARVKVENVDKLLQLDPDQYDACVISPGPKAPKDYPEYRVFLEKYQESLPFFGVCLGHQILGALAGARVARAPGVMHGKTSLIKHTGSSLFQGLPQPMKVARYHSLLLEETPQSFDRLAWTEEGLLMGMKHQTLPLYGVQFHPESFLTEAGDFLMRNFLNEVRGQI